MISKVKGWQVGLVGIIFLAIAYGFASLAIDSGSLFAYFLALVFLILAIKNIIYVVRHRPTK